jgi:hypothetical protein
MAAVALLLGLPMAAGAQSPANCNANLLDESVSRSTATAGAGDIVTYLVTATDRTLLPPGCVPGTVGCAVGCDTLNVTANFCCPGPTGAPAVAPSPLCINLVTNASVPAQDNTVVFGVCKVSGVICRFLPTDCPSAGDTCGPFPCTMPDLGGPGVATAGVFGTGELNDGFDSPLTIDKTIAVNITTSTTTTTTTSTTTTTTSTTTTTTSTTTTTTAPPLCLSRTPGFWGNHPFLITGSDPRSLNLLPLDVCGITFDNTAAGNGTSTTEAICSVGTDGKILGPQETQLIRQCVSAALNIATTSELGGDCFGAFPGLDVAFAGCCSDSSVCTGVDTGISIGDCLTIIGAFNQAESNTVTFPFNPGPAKSGTCRSSKGNGVVTTP